jgi:hypothetical protein
MLLYQDLLPSNPMEELSFVILIVLIQFLAIVLLEETLVVSLLVEITAAYTMHLMVLIRLVVVTMIASLMTGESRVTLIINQKMLISQALKPLLELQWSQLWLILKTQPLPLQATATLRQTPTEPSMMLTATKFMEN